MMDRREFIRGGLSAVALGALGNKGLLANQRPPRSCVASGALQISATTPLLEIPSSPASTVVDGIPFANWFFGDDYDNDHIPFHFIPDYFNGGPPPEPAEEIDVAVVGGGLSGLASAYLLRHHNTVLFELRDRFGGNAMGEDVARHRLLVRRRVFYYAGSRLVPGALLPRARAASSDSHE